MKKIIFVFFISIKILSAATTSQLLIDIEKFSINIQTLKVNNADFNYYFDLIAWAAENYKDFRSADMLYRYMIYGDNNKEEKEIVYFDENDQIKSIIKTGDKLNSFLETTLNADFNYRETITVYAVYTLAYDNPYYDYESELYYGPSGGSVQQYINGKLHYVYYFFSKPSAQYFLSKYDLSYYVFKKMDITKEEIKALFDVYELNDK